MLLAHSWCNHYQCVCVCVCEREREKKKRKRVSERVSVVCVSVFVCIIASVCWGRVQQQVLVRCQGRKVATTRLPPMNRLGPREEPNLSGGGHALAAGNVPGYGAAVAARLPSPMDRTGSTLGPNMSMWSCSGYKSGPRVEYLLLDTPASQGTK